MLAAYFLLAVPRRISICPPCWHNQTSFTEILVRACMSWGSITTFLFHWDAASTSHHTCITQHAIFYLGISSWAAIETMGAKLRQGRCFRTVMSLWANVSSQIVCWCWSESPSRAIVSCWTRTGDFRLPWQYTVMTCEKHLNPLLLQAKMVMCALMVQVEWLDREETLQHCCIEMANPYIYPSIKLIIPHVSNGQRPSSNWLKEVKININTTM